VDNNASPDVIQQQMMETRTSLSEKVTQLEEQVMGTVQSATDAMQTTVEKVKDSVKDVTSSVEESVTSMRDTVRQTFDISSHVRERPWLALGAAVVTGFVTGRLLSGDSPTEDEAPRSRFAAMETPPARAAFAEPAKPGWIDKILERANEELSSLGDSVMTQLIAALRTGVEDGVPKLIGEVEHRITGNGHAKVASGI